MTKVWLLYDDPYDEGANIHGAFSTEEKANEAHKIFSKVSNYELYLMEFELDSLEKFYERAISGERRWIGERFRQEWRDGSIHYGEWQKFSASGLDTLFEEDRKNLVMERKNVVWAHIIAKSEDEAKEVAEKIHNEKEEGYMEWLK